MRSQESCQEPCPALTAAAVRGLGAVREFLRGEVRQTGGNIKKRTPKIELRNRGGSIGMFQRGKWQEES